MKIQELLKSEASTLKLLYVEDELETQKKVSKIFEMFFQEVVCAENGVVALQEYEKSSFDLVITDLTMPGKDGMELIRDVKAINSSQRIIVITAHNNNENLMGTIDLQVDGFLLKPVGMDKLLNLLYKVVHEIYLEQKNSNFELENHNEFGDELNDLKSKLNQGGQGTLVVITIKNQDTLNDTFGSELMTHLFTQSYDYLSSCIPMGSSFYQWHRNMFLFYFEEKETLEVYQIVKEFMTEHGSHNIDFNEIPFPVQYSYVLVSGEGLDLMGKLNIIQNTMHKYKDNLISLYDTGKEDAQVQENALFWVRKTVSALEDDRVVPFYQPIYSLPERVLTAYEVLARIEEHGSYSEPKFFIEPSQKAGIVEDVSIRIYQKALEDLSSREATIHFNISDDELNSDFLLKNFIPLCQEYNVDPGTIVLEINHQSPYREDTEVRERLDKLRSLGYKVLVESFSESKMNLHGFSSFIPDIIKIDYKFLMAALDCESIKNILRALLAFTKALNVKSAAVGVENEAVFEFVNELGFDYAQGYYLGMPSEQKEGSKDAHF